MKNIIRIIIIVLFLPLLFSCNKKSNLEHALELAGKNRVELEKVLEHYKHEPLKLKAAKFLIENMDVYSFISSPGLDAYYRTLDSIFALNKQYDNITTEQDSLLAHLNEPNPIDFKYIPDLQYVSADFLIDNIDRAFEAWKSPFAKDLNFNDFCEYLLPYKVGFTDRPRLWRSDYYDTFYPYVKFMLNDTCRLDSGLIFHSPSFVLKGDTCRTLSKTVFDTVPDFTISCWINPSENKPMVRVFDFGKDKSYYLCYIPYSKEKNATLEIRTNKTWKFLHADSLPLAQPSHIVVSYSKNCVLFYMNGLLTDRVNVYLDNKNFTSNLLGVSNWFGDTNYFNGSIEDFRIYNRELNYREVCTLAGKNKDSLDRKHKVQEILWRMRDLYRITTIYENLFPGSYDPAYVKNTKKATCYDYTVLGTYIFRSLGIPAGIDFVPQWANRNMGHDWSVIYTGNRMEDYSFSALWDTLGYEIKSRDDKASKIFRRTYAKQANSLAMQNKAGDILPQTFQNPCIKDVTDSYLNYKNITVSFTRQPPKKREYAYLCNFNNQDWIPAYWGKIRGHTATFKKMGEDVVYLPAYYNQWAITPIADPFILNKEGKIKNLIPDHSKTQTMILKRKYKTGSVLEKGKLLVGGRFQVANKADFSDSLTVYKIKDIPEILYNSVNIALKKPYRYFRFLSPPGSFGGEISEIEIYSMDSIKLTGKVVGNRNCLKGWEVENVFDGDPLTSYLCNWGETGWAGLDFDKPTYIAYFRYLPRNDDNFIKEGEEYELFYWENYQWNSLGKQTGTSKQYLEYMNAPLNALFWLRNLTKGKEERIFTYENGQQVWW